MSMKNDKILVEIAAYRDPELINTVKSAIVQADNPDRVYFSICYQWDELEQYQELQKMDHCRIKYLTEKEAKGSCYARYLCQQMIEDEKYIFQVDSHMRFVKHWDTKMIQMLLSTHDKKASISFYPPDCTEEMMELPLDDSVFDNPCSGGLMYTKGFQDGDSLFLFNQCAEVVVKEHKKPTKNPFTSAGNFFSFADIHRNVLHDPEMYFYGDELPMAIRYYTHGWNNYSAGKSYVYHKYNRKGQTFPNNDNHNVSTEIVRFKHLLNLDHEDYDMGEFGLGTERTIEDYEKFAGINFRKKLVYMSAETGKFEDPELKTKLSYFTAQKANNQMYCILPEKIEVIVVDREGDYQDCIQSCLDHTVYKNNLSFIVGTVKREKISKELAERLHIKKIIAIDPTTTYSYPLSRLALYLSSGIYCAIIDTSMRFLYGWDKFYCEAIKKCGSSAALTSWVWYDVDGLVDEKFSPYVNIVKEFDYFNNYLPVLKHNDNINLSNRKYSYKTNFIMDGFLFCKSDMILSIKIDPNLRYDEHNSIYAARLWTNGIDFYIPNTSFYYRIRSEETLLFGYYHYEIVCALFRIDNVLGRSLRYDYEYGLGTVRTLWEWYDSMGFDYAKDPLYDA